MLTLAHRLMLAGASFKGLSGGVVTLSPPSGYTASSGVFSGAALAPDGDLVILAATSSPAYEAALIKITNQGTIVWQRRLQMSLLLYGANSSAIGIDGSGNIYVAAAGRNSGTVDAAQVLKYSSGGALLWQRSIGPSGVSPTVSAMAVDASGNTYICATSGVTLGQNLIKYNAAGTLQWHRNVTRSTDSTHLGSVACEPGGDVYLSGTWTDAGVRKGTLRRYNTSGVLQWERAYHNSSTVAGQLDGMVVDGSGNIFAGLLMGATSRPGVVKVNSSGVVQWARHIDVASSGPGGCIGLSKDGTAAWVNIPITAGRIVVKYGADGDILMQRSISGSQANTGDVLRVVESGNDLLMFGRAAQPTNIYSAVIGKFPASGLGTGSYGWVGYSETTAVSSTLSLTTQTTTMTDSAGTWTDAAGGVTDSAASWTATYLSKT